MVTLTEEEPFAAVVCPTAQGFTCAKCFSVLFGQALDICRICRSVRYCSSQCRKSDWELIHKDECGLLKDDKVPMDVRLVIRLLLRVKNDPSFEAFNERTWYYLDDNMRERKKDQEFRKNTGTPFFNAVKALMGELTPLYEDVMSAWGKMTTNALPITDNTWSCNFIGVGLYIGLSVHPHKCLFPDAWVVSNGSKMILRTTKTNVMYTSKLSIDYLAFKPPKTTEMRQKNLLAAYGFTCECDECVDPKSDLKLRAGLCPFCPKGWFTAQTPFCVECTGMMTDEHVEDLNQTNAFLSAFVADLDDLWNTSAPNPSKEKWQEAITVFHDMKNRLPMYNSNMMALIEIIARDVRNEAVCAAFLLRGLPVIRQLPPGPFRYTWICRRAPILLYTQSPSWEYRGAIHEALECVKVSHGKDHPLTVAYREICEGIENAWVYTPPSQLIRRY